MLPCETCASKLRAVATGIETTVFVFMVSTSARIRLEASYARLKVVRPGGNTMMKGLSVQVNEDGVWLVFESSSGKGAIVNAETIAEDRPPIAAEAIREWIQDQLQSKVFDA